LLCKKTDQRCICFSFNRWRAKLDLHRAGVFAHDPVDFRARNNVNANNCHLAILASSGEVTRPNLAWHAIMFAPMKPRHVYLILCVLGIVLPYLQLVPWLLEHGLNATLFFRELLASRISAFFAMDVIVSAIVLLCFIQSEGKRLQVRFLWLPVIGTLLVGVSLGFPLFLFLRQLTLDRTNVAA
jgi:Terpene cyclase DEP1